MSRTSRAFSCIIGRAIEDEESKRDAGRRSKPPRCYVEPLTEEENAPPEAGQRRPDDACGGPDAALEGGAEAPHLRRRAARPEHLPSQAVRDRILRGAHAVGSCCLRWRRRGRPIPFGRPPAVGTEGRRGRADDALPPAGPLPRSSPGRRPGVLPVPPLRPAAALLGQERAVAGPT